MGVTVTYWTVEFELDEGFYVYEWRQRGNLRPRLMVTYGPLVGREVAQVLDDVVCGEFLRSLEDL